MSSHIEKLIMLFGKFTKSPEVLSNYSFLTVDCSVYLPKKNLQATFVKREVASNNFHDPGEIPRRGTCASEKNG